MKKINLSYLSPQAITTFIISFIALANIIMQVFGYSPVNVDEQSVYNIISTIFVIGTTLMGMYKNFNVTDASSKAQEITDLLKSGELLVSDVDELIKSVKENNN